MADTKEVLALMQRIEDKQDEGKAHYKQMYDQLTHLKAQIQKEMITKGLTAVHLGDQAYLLKATVGKERQVSPDELEKQWRSITPDECAAMYEHLLKERKRRPKTEVLTTEYVMKKVLKQKLRPAAMTLRDSLRFAKKPRQDDVVGHMPNSGYLALRDAYKAAFKQRKKAIGEAKELRRELDRKGRGLLLHQGDQPIMLPLPTMDEDDDDLSSLASFRSASSSSTAASRAAAAPSIFSNRLKYLAKPVLPPAAVASLETAAPPTDMIQVLPTTTPAATTPMLTAKKVTRKYEKPKRMKLKHMVNYIDGAWEDTTSNQEFSVTEAERVLSTNAVAVAVKAVVEQGLHDRIHTVAKVNTVRFGIQ